MTRAAPRRSGRPRLAVLTREGIMATALRLLDERGADGAGIREIARELGVRPSALYNHVRGYDDIVDGVRELVSDRIDTSGFGNEPWPEALCRWAVSYRDAFAAHPPTIALLAVRPLRPGSRTGVMYEQVCAGLVSAGWPDDSVLSVIVALESFVLGSALDAAAPDDMLDPASSPGVPTFQRVYAARSAALARAAATSGPDDEAFALGLASMIDGLVARHARLTGR